MAALNRMTLALLLAPVACAPVPLAAPVPDALVELNKVVRENYRDSRTAVLARTRPVIVVAFDDATLLREGHPAQTATITPRLYHRYKEIAHIPFGVHVTVTPYVDRADDGSWRAPLQRLLDHVIAAQAMVATVGIPADRLARQRRIIDASIAYMRDTLARGVVEGGALRAYSRGMAPLVLANADDASALQIDGLHTVVSGWKAAMPAAEWARLHVLVLGPKAPREGNLAMQYFERLLGAGAVGRRLIYTEGIFASEAALTLLGGLVIDRAVARDFFSEELRMDRDLLSDGARRRLDQVFGRVAR